MTHQIRFAAGFALLGLAATACGVGGAEGARSESNGGTIVYADQFGPMAAWAPETDDAHTLTRAGCLETLIRYEPDGTLSPNLATQWNKVEPTVWEIGLREDVQFQDGTPMDAEAVAGALQHVLDAKAPARAFNPDLVSGVEATGEATIEVTTTAPDALMPLRLASPNTGILAPKAYAETRIDIMEACTGPFTVVDEVPRQSLHLERNDSYWGDKAQVAKVEVQYVIDGAARATMAQTGEAQIAAAIPAVNRAALEGDPGSVALHERPIPRTTVMLLNNSRPPFDDPLVRQAMQHALNLEAIASTVYEGGASAAVGPFSPEDPWAPEDAEPPTFDPDEARRLLNQANVDPGSMTIELIAYNERPEFGDLAAVIQDQLSQLGIAVKIKTGEYASFEPELLSGNYDAALLSRGYLVDLADPAGYLLSDYSCGGSYNIASYCDPDTTALIEQAAATEDIDSRHELYGQIAQNLQRDAASVFLVHEHVMVATSTNIENFDVHPLEYRVLTPQLALGGG